jgi:MFS transporter, DHA1 family, chloramphenicol/florfenicol resistance protein
MHKYKISQLVFILTPFVFSFAFGLDIYIPIVPQMAEIFNTSPALIQLTLSLFLFITGVGQLVIGPLSDQFGRKIIFYWSAACFTIGSIGCVLSPSITWLIIARLISSLGACGMLVTSFALIRDLYNSEESAKIYSFLNGAIGISPTFAPIIGGYLAVYWGWQSIFFFLAAIGIFSFVNTNLFVQETHPNDLRVRMDKNLFIRYWQIFANKQFLIYSAIAGFAEAVFFCFFSISPFIIIDELGIPTQEFGYYFAAFGMVIAVGGFASGKVIEKIGIQPTIAMGIILMLIGGISMLVWDYLDALSLQGFLFPMIIACTGAMFIIGGSASAALEPFGLIAGTAAAAFGAVEFSISAFIGSLLMFFPTSSTIPYGIIIVLMSTFSLFLFIIWNTNKNSFRNTP